MPTFDINGNPIETGTPAWWVGRLSWKLDQRLGLAQIQRSIGPYYAISPERWESYYRGDLNLALTSGKWRDEFAIRFPSYSSNLMETVVDKHRERLAVQGIRYADNPDADKDAWAWWQRNRMDAEAPKLYREALVKGQGYILVWPNAAGEPEMSIEIATEMIVENVPGRAWQRRAALKRWVDLDDGKGHAELYLPDGVYKFISAQSQVEFSSQSWWSVVAWEPLQIPGEAWPIRNPIGIVPVVPFVHRPDTLGEGESAIKPVASNQDAINMYRVNAFVAAEFASFKQRWAIGLDIPVDPITGKPVEPFQTAVDRLWAVGPPDPNVYPDASKAPTVQFGEFTATDLAPFYTSIEGEVKLMGTISRIPYHQLSPQAGQPPSGDSIRSSESGLVAMVTDSEMTFGEAHEEVFRLMFAFRGDARANDMTGEVLWREAATQSEAARMDALVKMLSLGVPEEAIWERIPDVTPAVIARWRRMKAQAALEAAILAPQPPAPAAPPATPTIVKSVSRNAAGQVSQITEAPVHA